MDASQTGAPIDEHAETDQPQSHPKVITPREEPKAKKPKAAPRAPPNADRPPGKSLLPLARVQRIIKADKELTSCNKEAMFLISVAAEEFIKRLSQAGQLQAVREKRTTVQQKDVVTAVRRADEFVFLEEILSANVSAPPPAPVKRKPKANAAATTETASLSIQEAFGKGKAKSSTAFHDDERPLKGADLPDPKQQGSDSIT